MYKINNSIDIINSLIIESSEDKLRNMLPISLEDLRNNQLLCEDVIDYLGDIYVTRGLDAQYCENEFGKRLSSIMTFLAECNT